MRPPSYSPPPGYGQDHRLVTVRSRQGMVKDHRLVTVRRRQSTVTNRRRVTVRRHQSTVTVQHLVTDRRLVTVCLQNTVTVRHLVTDRRLVTVRRPLTDRLPVTLRRRLATVRLRNPTTPRRRIVDYVRLHHRSKRPCKLRADQMQRCFALVCLSEIGTLSSASPRTAPSCRSLARSTFKARMRSDLSRLEARRRTCLRGVLSLLLRHRRGTNRNPASEKARPVEVRPTRRYIGGFRKSQEYVHWSFRMSVLSTESQPFLQLRDPIFVLGLSRRSILRPVQPAGRTNV